MPEILLRIEASHDLLDSAKRAVLYRGRITKFRSDLMGNVPASRPKATRDQVLKLIPASVKDKVVIVGVRGYYEDTMGKPGVNERNLYDDAIFVVTPGDFRSFNANTDPSVYRKGIATLAPGVHRYKKGQHKGKYFALRPATKGEELPVTRDGVSVPWPGIAINIHKGGKNSTSSEGCQTLYPSQWQEFIDMVYAAMAKYGQGTVPYVLVVQ